MKTHNLTIANRLLPIHTDDDNQQWVFIFDLADVLGLTHHDIFDAIESMTNVFDGSSDRCLFGNITNHTDDTGHVKFGQIRITLSVVWIIIGRLPFSRKVSHDNLKTLADLKWFFANTACSLCQSPLAESVSTEPIVPPFDQQLPRTPENAAKVDYEITTLLSHSPVDYVAVGERMIWMRQAILLSEWTEYLNRREINPRFAHKCIDRARSASGVKSGNDSQGRTAETDAAASDDSLNFNAVCLLGHSLPVYGDPQHSALNP